MEPFPEYGVDQKRQGPSQIAYCPKPGAVLPESVASITSLADEILLDHIYLHLNPRDVARMSCVCRRFHQFATNIWVEKGLDTRINHDWFYSYLLRNPTIRKSENDYRKSMEDHLRNATSGKVTQESLDGLFKKIDSMHEELFSACSTAEMKMVAETLTNPVYQSAMERLSVVLRGLQETNSHPASSKEDRAHQAWQTAMRRKYAGQDETNSHPDTTTNEDRAPSMNLIPASAKPKDATLPDRKKLAAVLITCPVSSQTRKIMNNKLNPTHPPADLYESLFSDDLPDNKSEKEVDDQIIERLSEALNLSDLQILVRINASPDFQAMQKKLMEKHQAVDMFIRLSAFSLITDVVLHPRMPDA